MTKKEYLDILGKIQDFINAMAKEIREPNDMINLYRLQFEVCTAVYNCSKEN